MVGARPRPSGRGSKDRAAVLEGSRRWGRGDASRLVGCSRTCRAVFGKRPSANQPIDSGPPPAAPGGTRGGASRSGGRSVQRSPEPIGSWRASSPRRHRPQPVRHSPVQGGGRSGRDHEAARPGLIDRAAVPYWGRGRNLRTSNEVRNSAGASPKCAALGNARGGAAARPHYEAARPELIARAAEPYWRGGCGRGRSLEGARRPLADAPRGFCVQSDYHSHPNHRRSLRRRLARLIQVFAS